MVWFWNFGDGSQESMLPDPSHTFMDPGSYGVTLIASNELGETEVHKQTISVFSAYQITAGFVESPTSGPASLTVQFTDQSTGSVSSWIWEFGDGSTDTTWDSLHTHLNSGVYTVTLIVSPDKGISDSEQKMNCITVTDSPVSGSILLSPGCNFVSVPALLTTGKDTAEIF